MNKQEIQQKYLNLHKTVGTQKEAEDKVAFDIAHRKVWADCDAELKVRKVELETQGTDSPEFNELKGMFPEPRPPARDYAKEIDELRAEIKKLKLKGGASLI